MLPNPSSLVSTHEQSTLLITRMVDFAPTVQAYALRLLRSHVPESDDERFEIMVRRIDFEKLADVVIRISWVSILNRPTSLLFLWVGSVNERDQLSAFLIYLIKSLVELCLQLTSGFPKVQADVASSAKGSSCARWWLLNINFMIRFTYIHLVDAANWHWNCCSGPFAPACCQIPRAYRFVDVRCLVTAHSQGNDWAHFICRVGDDSQVKQRKLAVWYSLRRTRFHSRRFFLELAIKTLSNQ